MAPVWLLGWLDSSGNRTRASPELPGLARLHPVLRHYQTETRPERLGAKDPFWHLRVRNPGQHELFHPAVYLRGAMTLHQL